MRGTEISTILNSRTLMRRLTFVYLAASGSIALFALLGQILIQAKLVFLSSMLVIGLLEGLYVFRSTAKRLRRTLRELTRTQERITRTTLELQERNATIELALDELLISNQHIPPRAQLIAAGRYRVQSIKGNSFTVLSQERDGKLQFACECFIYNRNSTCPHTLAASTLHDALLHYHCDISSMQYVEAE